MTKKDQISREQELVLQTLYRHKGYNLTPQGYLEALIRLRRDSPKKARHVERILAPLLRERLFRRRQEAWHESSAGQRARLILLPENPHLERDICAVRKALVIPDDQIKPTVNDEFWKEVSKRVKSANIRKVVEGNLAGDWLHIHVAAAMGRDISKEEMGNLLSDSLCQSAIASAKVDLHGKDIPDWLQISPSGPAPYDRPAVPLDWAAGRLVERYRLPWSAARALGFYILTENPEWVGGLEPIHVEITHENDSKDPEAFNVYVKGIDEFVTKEDWARIWVNYIKPRQNYLWELRGMKPQGRRSVDILRLQKALPLYRKMVQENRQLKEFLGWPKAEWKDDIMNKIMTESDQETIRRAILDLKKLLTPAP